MSTNVDQRSKGQPSQVSIGASKDADQYSQPPPHQMRSSSDQTSHTTYGGPTLESFFQNFYPPNMTYPFMGSEGSWSNGTDTMFGMGYDYSNVYGGFGFPFNNWDYSNDYWGTSQGVRKHQRSYTTEEGYYPPEMMPPDAYGVINGAAVAQEPIGTVEQGMRAIVIAPSSSSMNSSSRNKVLDISQPFMCDTDRSTAHSQCVQSSVMCAAFHNQAKKTSWAAIASQPARPQQQRPRTIPRAPVNPNRPHNMDIGTWDGRGNSSKAPLQPPPSSLPSQSRQSWTASCNRSQASSRHVQPHSGSGSAGDMADNGYDFNSNNSSNQSSHSLPCSSNGASTEVPSNPEQDITTTNGDSYQHSALASTHPVLDQLKSSNLYNPKEFNLNSKSARFFIIKSYSEDDIHRSIKYNIWCSTEHGNKRLDLAFRDREGKGPVYLIYSVNGSGHFCGIAQMMSPVDYNRSAGVWAQDKWKGQFSVKWVYVKDVPNGQLRHIRLENNENKPVTNSRDTQEVPPEKGKQVLHIVHSYKHTTSIFDDFIHYEKRQEQDAGSGQQQRDHHAGDRDQRGADREQRGGDREQRGGDREQRGGDREQRGGDREHRGADREQRGADREQRGADREQRGVDREHKGWDRVQRGGDRVQRGGNRGQAREDWGQRGGEERDQRGVDNYYHGDRDSCEGPGSRNRDKHRQDGASVGRQN